MIIGIIITGGCLGYLQFGRDMDVYGSHAMTADNYHEERLTVVVNKLYVADQKIYLKKRISAKISFVKPVIYSAHSLTTTAKIK